MQVIYSPARGKYALQEKETFLHKQTQSIKRLAKVVQKNHPTTKFSIYSTECLTRFSKLTYPANNLIIDVEGSSLKTTYQSIKTTYSNAFLFPEEANYRHSISPERENIIVNRLYADAPLTNIDSFYYVPKLEKILIDLIINDPIILMISKHEMKQILTHIHNTYNINYSTLKRYAKKRYLDKKSTDFGLIKI